MYQREPLGGQFSNFIFFCLLLSYFPFERQFHTVKRSSCQMNLPSHRRVYERVLQLPGGASRSQIVFYGLELLDSIQTPQVKCAMYRKYISCR